MIHSALDKHIVSFPPWFQVIALDVKDITDTYISVTKTYDVINELTGPPKTLTSIREVFIQPELAKCIKDYNKWRKSYCILTGIRSKHFFFNKSGEYIAYTSYEKHLKEIYLHVTKKLVENDNKLIKKANIIS